jgi:hypothetical protein
MISDQIAGIIPLFCSSYRERLEKCYIKPSIDGQIGREMKTIKHQDLTRIQIGKTGLNLKYQAS